MNAPAEEADRVALRHLLILLTAASALHMLDRQIIAILLEPIRFEFRLSDSQLGLLTGLAYSVATIAVGLPLGMLADRISRKRLLICVLAVWSGLTALCGAATTFPILIMTRMGVGAAESGGPPTCIGMISDAFPPARRGRAISVYYSGAGLGTLLSFTIGAWTAVTWGWRAAFLIAGVPGLVLTIVLAFCLVEPVRTNVAISPGQGFVARHEPDFTHMWILALISVLFLSIATTAIGGWAASILIREHGLQIGVAGTVVAVALGIMQPAGQLLGGWLADRTSQRGSVHRLYIASVATATGCIVIMLTMASADPVRVILGLMVAIPLLTIYVGPAYSLLADYAPPRMRGTVIAIATVGANVAGYGGGPLLVGLISDRLIAPHALSRAVVDALVVPLFAAGVIGVFALVKARQNRF